MKGSLPKPCGCLRTWSRNSASRRWRSCWVATPWCNSTGSCLLVAPPAPSIAIQRPNIPDPSRRPVHHCSNPEFGCHMTPFLRNNLHAPHHKYLHCSILPKFGRTKCRHNILPLICHMLLRCKVRIRMDLKPLHLDHFQTSLRPGRAKHRRCRDPAIQGWWNLMHSALRGLTLPVRVLAMHSRHHFACIDVVQLSILHLLKKIFAYGSDTQDTT